MTPTTTQAKAAAARKLTAATLDDARRPRPLSADVIRRLALSLAYMRGNFTKGLTLNDVAKVAQLSPFHFHRVFRQWHGDTPKHVLLACQIARAKALLVGRKSLTEIADECGFATHSHFCWRFKQATGFSPLKWRRAASEGKVAA